MPSKDLSITKKCLFCSKEFHPYKKRPGLFCSAFCQRKGRRRKPEKKVIGKCLNCNKEFEQPKWWKSPAKYCSIQCMSKKRGESMRGENHPLWKGGKNNRTGIFTLKKEIFSTNQKCANCQCSDNLQIHHKIEVSKRPDLATEINNIEILCKECHAKEHPEYAPMLLKKKEGVNLICKSCKKEFYRCQARKHYKYCSKECQYKVQKTGFYKNCLVCNEKFYTVPSKTNSKYCSNKCRALNARNGNKKI